MKIDFYDKSSFALYLSQIFVNITNENLKISIIITLLMEEKK